MRDQGHIRPRMAGILPCVTPALKRGTMDGMKIELNGDARAFDQNLTLEALLALEGLAERRVAVEVNGDIIPRGRHETHVLQDGDRVEIVHALGGG